LNNKKPTLRGRLFTARFPSGRDGFAAVKRRNGIRSDASGETAPALIRKNEQIIKKSWKNVTAYDTIK